MHRLIRSPSPRSAPRLLLALALCASSAASGASVRGPRGWRLPGSPRPPLSPAVQAAGSATAAPPQLDTSAFTSTASRSAVDLIPALDDFGLPPPPAPPADGDGAWRGDGDESGGDATEVSAPPDASDSELAALGGGEERGASMLQRHPMALKALSMGLTYGLADCAAQLYERLAAGERAPLAERARRNAALVLVGLLAVGPLLSVWFDALEGLVPGGSIRAVLTRTALDQALQVPVMISLIFTLSALAEGHDAPYCAAKVRSKLLPTWKGCVGVWAPVQMLNQGVVPLRYRVMFQAFVSFFWDAYMSIAAHAHPEDGAVGAA